MLIDGPKNSRATIILAHGAGAPMDTPYMNTIAAGLAADGLRVVRFEFAYMAKRRIDGIRRGPERIPTLLNRWLDVLDEIGETKTPLLIGGKSMGGRSAAMLAAETNISLASVPWCAWDTPSTPPVSLKRHDWNRYRQQSAPR